MALFRKKVIVFREKNREHCLKAQALLVNAGFQGVRRGAFEENPVCGCGAKLDPRDFGPNGKIDRNTYYLRVYQEDAEAALAILREAGL